MVRTLRLAATGLGSTPGWGTKIPRALSKNKSLMSDYYLPGTGLGMSYTDQIMCPADVGMEHFQLYANVSIVNKIHIHLEGLLSLQQFLSLCTLFQVVLKRVSLYLKRLVNTG